MPWLIEASVCMTFGIVRPFGDSISRPTALTIPAVIVRSSPNGLPIAYAASPTPIDPESPNTSGWSADAGAVTRTTAMSLEGSTPTIFAGYEPPPENPTRILLALLANWGIAAAQMGQVMGLLPWESMIRLGPSLAWTLASLANPPVDQLWLWAALVLAVAISR